MPHSEILGSQPARGSPRLFAACHVLHRLLAPRHPPDALAFLGPHQRQPHHTPHQVCDPAGTPPVGARRRRREEDAAAAAGKAIPASTATTSAGRSLAARSQQAASIPMPNMRPAADGRRGQDAHDLPAPAAPRRMQESLLACPHDGHLVTTSRCPRNMRRGPGPKGRRRADGVPGFGRPGQARATTAAPPPSGKRGLVGLGRLERPTSRLSGVRSNQLSYRPERHPAGPRQRAARTGRTHDLVTRGPRVQRLCAKGRADGGGRF